MVTTTIKYDINEKPETIAENLVQTARIANINLGNGNISVNGEEVSAMSVSGAAIVSFESDTANISITGGEIDTTTFVSAVTMSGAGSASISNGTLNISVPAADKFTVQGSEVSAISVNGAAGVVIDNNTAIINVTGGGVSKLNPNLTVTPNPVIFNAESPATATLTANADSDAILQFLKFGDITMETVSPTQVEITPNVLTGNATVQVFSPENADYYGQFKVANVSMNYTPTIDFYVEGGVIKSDAGIEWLTSGSDVTVASNYIEVDNSSYVYMNVDSDTDFASTPFTLIMEFTPFTTNTTHIGSLSVFQETGQPGIRGIGFQYYGQSCQALITKDSGWINLADLPMTLGDEMQVKIVRDMVNCRVYLNGELKGTSQGLSNLPLSKAADKISLGQNVTVFGAHNYIKSFRLYKNVAV